MPPPLIGGGIKRCFCLTSVCLSRTSGLSREQRGLGKPKLAHVTRTPLSRSKINGHVAALVGCSSHYIIYMDTSFYATAQSKPLPVDHEYSWRWAPRRRVWAGAGLLRAAYRGGGILRGFPHSLRLHITGTQYSTQPPPPPPPL